MKRKIRVYFTVVSAAFIFFGTTAAAQPEFKGFENLFSTPKGYIVHHVNTAPVVDGDLNDAVWQQAAWTDDFADIEGNAKPRPPLPTNIKMLWDDSCLYIAARVTDPQVWANLKNRDDIVFLDNDLEVFINPNGTTHQYYEIECNALNTIFDLYLNKPYRNLGNPMAAWDAKGMRTAVKIQGSLNDPSNIDKGWTLEMAIPFRAVSVGNRVQVPAEGTTWRINFSRVEWDTKVVNGKYVKLKDSSGRNLPEHNWVWSPQGVVNMHFPERWGYLQFSKNTGNKSFVLPYAELQKQYLWLIYYRQMAWQKLHKAYAPTLTALDIGDNIVINKNNNSLQLEATPHQFIAFITDSRDHITWTINQEGLIRQIKLPTT